MPSNLRNRIIQSATELFAQQGYHNTSFLHIARAAGCAAGTVRWYFRRKEVLLSDVLDRAWRTLLVKLNRPSEIIDPVERLDSFVFSMLTSLEADSSLTNLLLIEGWTFQPIGPPIVRTQPYLQFLSMIDRVLDGVRAAGRMRPDISNVAARSALLGILQATLRDEIVHRRCGFPKGPSQTERQQLIKLVLSAIVPARSLPKM